VTAWSTQDPAVPPVTKTLEITVVVAIYELSVSEILLDGKISEEYTVESGAEVTISVDVTYTGSKQFMDQRVSIDFYIDDELISRENVTSIPEGGSRRVSVSWTAADKGTYAIKVVVDPEEIPGDGGVIPETNEEDNIAFATVEVVEPGADGAEEPFQEAYGGNLFVLLLILTVAALVSAGGVVAFIKKRKAARPAGYDEKGEYKPYEEPKKFVPTFEEEEEAVAEEAYAYEEEPTYAVTEIGVGAEPSPYSLEIPSYQPEIYTAEAPSYRKIPSPAPETYAGPPVPTPKPVLVSRRAVLRERKPVLIAPTARAEPKPERKPIKVTKALVKTKPIPTTKPMGAEPEKEKEEVKGEYPEAKPLPKPARRALPWEKPKYECPKCGNLVEKDWFHCPKCKTRLSKLLGHTAAEAEDK
jgi:hypothetical protein